jgi:hypothetical protein
MHIRIGMDDPTEVLLALGYVHRPRADDYLKNDVNGRFHAKVNGKQITIHYDLDVDGKHVASIPMPYLMQKERARVQSYKDSKRIKELKRKWTKQALATN